MIRTNVCLDPDSIEFLRTLGGGKVVQGIREAARLLENSPPASTRQVNVVLDEYTDTVMRRLGNNNLSGGVREAVRRLQKQG